MPRSNQLSYIAIWIIDTAGMRIVFTLLRLVKIGLPESVNNLLQDLQSTRTEYHHGFAGNRYQVIFFQILEHAAHHFS